MDKSILNQINNLRTEIKFLKDRIKKIDEKPVKIVSDSVTGSSSVFPYTKHTCKVEGIEHYRVIRNRKNKNKYRKQIKSKEFKLEKLIIELEYQLNYIGDGHSDIREIIRLKYEDDLSWLQIMFKLGYDSENKARMKLERYLEKNKKI